MIKPSQNPVTLGFGSTAPPYSVGEPHIGVDFAPKPDPVIYAPEDGHIVLVLGDPRMGDSIHLYAGNRHHALCHTSKHFVSSGQQVKQGQELGIMGYTGYVVPPGPAGTHLHYALAIDGTLVDPLKYVTGEDDMYEGRTAESWALQAKDAEAYKQQVIQSEAWVPDMKEDVNRVKAVINDGKVYKDAAVAGGDTVYVEIPGPVYVKQVKERA